MDFSPGGRTPRGAPPLDTFERDRQQARALAREQQQQQRNLGWGYGAMGGRGMGMSRPASESIANTTVSPPSHPASLLQPAPEIQRLFAAVNRYIPSNFLPQLPPVGIFAAPTQPAHPHFHYGNEQPPDRAQNINFTGPGTNPLTQPQHFSPKGKNTKDPSQHSTTSGNISPRKHTQHTHRSNSPEKQPQRILRSSSPEKRTQRTLRSNSPEKRPDKKRSAYEEFQRIQKQAAQSAVQPTKKRKMADNSADEPAKRVRLEPSLEDNQASQQGTMEQASPNRLEALHEQFQVRARPSSETRPSAANADRILMPPPPISRAPPMLPLPQPGYPTFPSKNMSSFTDSLKKPVNPSNRGKQPASKPIQDMLHKPQNARITKQDYHTQHRKQPQPTQEVQKRAQIFEAEKMRRLRAQALDVHRVAEQQGVHMLDVELTGRAFKECQNYASTAYRFSHIDGVSQRESHQSVSLPGVKNSLDLTAGDGIAGPSRAVPQKGIAGPVGSSTGASNARDSDETIVESPTKNTVEKEPTRSTSHSTIPNDIPTPSIDETGTTDEAANPLPQGEFLYPYIDEDGFLRAPDPEEFSEQRADLEWMLQEIEERGKPEKRGWYRSRFAM